MNRTILLALLTFTVLGGFSCKDGNLGYDMIYTEFFNIQAGANPWQTHYFENTVAVRWEDYLGNLTPEDINRIEPRFAEITNNQGLRFNFIDRAVLEIYPDEDTSLAPWEMAFRENVPDNTGTTLQLIPTLTPFKDELTDGQFVYRIGLRYKQVPPETFQVRLDFGFRAFPN
jgi:hypothetical protein